MSEIELITKVAEALRVMRDEYDLPDDSATDEHVAETLMETLREQDLAIIDLTLI